MLVADAALGQEAVNVAKAFNEAVGMTGVVMTKLDGDARGGAALSIKAVSGAPIKFAGTGEKISDIEVFHADRMAQRILGMGDIVSLVEKAQENIDMQEAAKMAEKAPQGGVQPRRFSRPDAPDEKARPAWGHNENAAGAWRHGN